MLTERCCPPIKCFQLLGSFEVPNQEFKLEKVQLAAGLAFGSGKPLASASYDKDNRISCLSLRAGHECEDHSVSRTSVCPRLSDFGLHETRELLQGNRAWCD